MGHPPYVIPDLGKKYLEFGLEFELGFELDVELKEFDFKVGFYLKAVFPSGNLGLMRISRC